MGTPQPVSAFAVYSQKTAKPKPKTRSNSKKKLNNNANSNKQTNVESQIDNLKTQVLNIKSKKTKTDQLQNEIKKSKKNKLETTNVIKVDNGNRLKNVDLNSEKSQTDNNLKSQVVNVKSKRTKTDPLPNDTKKSKKMKLETTKVIKVENANRLKDVELNSEDDFVRKAPKNKSKDITNKKDLQTASEAVKTEKKSEKQTNINRIVITGPNSVENGKQLFSWVIYPIEVDEFFKRNWEKQPIFVKRNISSYFENLISSEEIDTVLRKRKLFFTKNIDITSYSEGKRETHNPPGRANAPLVWDYYGNGCSIRLLNPQKFFTKIHAMNALLQEFFGCLVGANVYLTPAGTQGFAPHYDDIEAFVLQIEGQKLWKLYPPKSPEENLPRVSSGNFNENDLGPPLEEILLSPGDMLYFPRGIIHQGKALEHTHSLHITLSMYQKNSWADLLEHLMPAALSAAIEEDVAFREGLPMGYLSHMGVVHSDTPSQQRAHFVNKLQDLIGRLVQYAPVDAACDQMGKQFIYDSLPPHLKQDETTRMVYGDGEKIQAGKVYNQAEVGMDTRVKLVRYNCLRVVTEDNTIRIYYSINNSREYHAEEPQFLEIDAVLAPAIDALICNYPDFLTVEDFPITSDMAKVQIASDLWEHGLLVTEEPLGYDSE